MADSTDALDHLELTPLPGSERTPAAGLEPSADALDPSERIEITLVLRRKAPLPDLTGTSHPTATPCIWKPMVPTRLPVT